MQFKLNYKSSYINLFMIYFTRLRAMFSTIVYWEINNYTLISNFIKWSWHSGKTKQSALVISNSANIVEVRMDLFISISLNWIKLVDLLYSIQVPMRKKYGHLNLQMNKMSIDLVTVKGQLALVLEMIPRYIWRPYILVWIAHWQCTYFLCSCPNGFIFCNSARMKLKDPE